MIMFYGKLILDKVMTKKKSKLSKKAQKQKSEKFDSNEMLAIEYYSRPFMLLGQSLSQYGYDIQKPHEIRKRFWSLLPPRIYEPLEIKPLLKQYNKSIERDLASIISKHSLAYWLHLYRRIGPYPAGLDDQPMTIGLVRAALEAAFQKYAQFTPCNSVGNSKDIPIEKILSGLLISDEFKLEQEIIQESPNQMVLTNFNTLDLLEVYQTEKLAYELWKSTAALRITGKNASITVTETESFFFDNRSDELDKLVQIFDKRHRSGDFSSSLTGISFADLINNDSSGKIFIPIYNAGHVSSQKFDELFRKVFKFSLKLPIIFNFVWIPYDIRNYRSSHLLFSEKFKEFHRVELDSVLLVISALHHRAFIGMLKNSLPAVYRYWQRAYEGPVKKQSIINEILGFIPRAAKILDIPDEQINTEKILAAVHFLELTSIKQTSIDLEYPGPHMVFLPYGDEMWFIDYAWLSRLLYNLFVGISPEDQKFKGDILEKVVNFKKSILPTKPCKSLSGDLKQIDASFEMGKRLIIVECKAIKKSIAFDKGESAAIQFRVDKFNKAVNEVDEKANWLAKHPQGFNYDIRQYEEILPIVISPFIEYVPSLNKFYWLDSDLPRIMTPVEFKSFLDNGKFAENLFNIVKIPQVDIE